MAVIHPTRPSSGVTHLGDIQPAVAQDGDTWYDESTGALRFRIEGAWINQPSLGTGYAAGGERGGGTAVSTIDKLSFSTDNVTALASTLNSTRYAGMGGFHSLTAGYAAGGTTPVVVVNSISKLAFVNEATSLLTSTLTASKYFANCGFESMEAGYVCGGFAENGSTMLSAIEKLTFMNESVAANVSGLTGTRYIICAGFAGTVAGYACGGNRGGGVNISTINKLLFSNDNVSTGVSGLSGTRYYGAGFESTSFGFSAGGNDGSSSVTTIDKVSFANDNVFSLLSGMYGTSTYYTVFGFSGNTAGYCGGGDTVISTITKLSFSNETTATNVSGLTGTRRYGVGSFENV